MTRRIEQSNYEDNIECLREKIMVLIRAPPLRVASFKLERSFSSFLCFRGENCANTNRGRKTRTLSHLGGAEKSTFLSDPREGMDCRKKECVISCLYIMWRRGQQTTR